MELNFFADYINLMTLGICLCIGYAIKEAKLFEKVGNQYIPLIMLVCGAVITVIAEFPNVTQVTILSGMISGLSATGMWELLRNFISK